MNNLSQEDKIAYIYENYQSKMFAIAKWYTWDGYLAEDAVSDPFIDIIQKIEEIKFKNCYKMPSIIKYIVKNNAIDIIRKRNR
ncbi:sigma factor [Tissierella praeacuta]|uniref:RNA polymerase sigma factor n=1 Tax=Tissierella praeacuta TaxID=43131 RepID=UPI00333F9289